MSTLALQREDGTIVPGEEIAAPVRNRIKQARAWRKQFELGWMLSMGLAAGKHWLTVDRYQRVLRRVQDVDPNYKGRELYSADQVTEYRTTMLGELGSDNDLPQLLLRHDDEAAEEYEAQANRAIQYGWDSEWRGDTVMAEIDRMVVDLGTAAIRCRFDPTVGPVLQDSVPFQNGKPLLSQADAYSAMQNGPNPSVQMKPVKQGRICWEPLSPFNLIVPPGITHESLFPWECVARPVLLTDVLALYPQTAAGLREDTDIGTILGTDTRTQIGDANLWASREGSQSRLRDHIWVFTYYERPTTLYPQGRTVIFGGNELRLLSVEESLPYQTPDGQPSAGLVYFHWWRVTGRFWSRSLVDSMKDAQRLLNKRRTQINEMIDRGMPVILVQEGSRVLDRKGTPGEFVELGPQERPPVPVSLVQPGAWLQQDVEAIREDFTHATGIQGPRLGENPQNVSTYSQLALISEQEKTKRDEIHRERTLAIARALEFSLYDIRQYWGPQKQIELAGDENRLEAFSFDATKLPPFFVLKVATGAAKPRTQAAQIQLIQDIWTGAVTSGAVQLDPTGWIAWYAKSLQSGEPLELPETPKDPQQVKAEYENHMLLQGEQPEPSLWDMVAVHIPVHRSAEDQAVLIGDVATEQRIEQHIQAHIAAAQQNAQQIQQMAPPPPVGAAAVGNGAAPTPPPGAPTPPQQ